MWDYILTWLTTPTSLFLLLNLTVATIVISHHFHKPPPHQNPNGIVKAPSLLQRVTSFDYTLRRGNEHVTEVTCATPEKATGILNPSEIEDLHVTNKEVDMGRHEEEEEGLPEKVTRKRRVVERTTSFGDDDDEGVDAKAEEFINRFKQQLKLQRLDSLLRYREMLKRN